MFTASPIYREIQPSRGAYVAEKRPRRYAARCPFAMDANLLLPPLSGLARRVPAGPRALLWLRPVLPSSEIENQTAEKMASIPSPMKLQPHRRRL